MRLLHLLSVPTVETHQRFKLEVDWDGDGLFANAYSDISSDVFTPVDAVRGRDYASQLTRRSVAGSLTTMLRNDDGLYSSFNSSSPLYGKILPNRKVRATALTPYTSVLWTGYLDSLVPAAVSNSPSGEPVASFKATGVFRQLGDQTHLVSPLPVTGGLTSDVVAAVLTELGITNAGQTGVVPLAHWFVPEGGRVGLDLLQEIWDETELGFLHEGTDWDLVSENRYYRQVYSASSVVTFSDDPASSYPYYGLTQEDALRTIYNRLNVTIQGYTADPLAVVWVLVDVASGSDPIRLAPGEARVFKAVSTAGYINPWTTPAVATDVISATGTLAVSNVVKSAQEMLFTVTNSHATIAASLTYVAARGVLYDQDDPSYVIGQDTASQALYGKRTYPLPSPWYSNEAYGQAAADYFVSLAKDPHPVLTLTFPGGAADYLASLATALLLSHRVTVDASRILTKLGVNQDFFVESIAHKFGPGISWETTLMLSPAAVAVAYWILGDSTYGVLDTTTKLAF